MDHPIIITLKADGSTAVVYHPAYQVNTVETLTASLGTVTEEARGGRVLPAAPLKRLAFRVLRSVFGDRGYVAEWTRTWAGDWLVLVESGESLGAFPSHQAGVDAEVQYLLTEVV